MGEVIIRVDNIKKNYRVYKTTTGSTRPTGRRSNRCCLAKAPAESEMRLKA